MEARKQGPLVSIGIPTFNRAHLLINAINSVLSQSYYNLEIVISDNASTDNTEEVCLSFAKTEPRIKYYRQERNIGPQLNYAFSLEKASGKYFMWLSDDDELLPETLIKYCQFLEDNPAYVLVSGKINYFVEDKYLMSEEGLSREESSPLLRSALYYFHVRHGALLYGLQRKSAALQIPVRAVIGDDWHFVASLAYLGKIKQFEYDGFSKDFGGSSNDFVGYFLNYANLYGEHKIWGYFPYVKISIDIVKEYCYKSPILSKSNIILRSLIGTGLAGWLILRTYLHVYPKSLLTNLHKLPQFIKTQFGYEKIKEQ